MNKFIVITTVVAISCLTSQADAQPGRGGPFGSSDFRQRMMERMDRNGDGRLDESEVPERAREFVARAARENGGSGRFPISIASIAGGRDRSDRGRGDRGRDRGGDDRGRRDRERDRGRENSQEFEYPLVPAFGDDVSGFGLDPRQLNGRMVDYEKVYDERVIRQLEQTLKSYDKDKNGVLEYEEWQAVRWQSDPRESDLNKDGALTSAELAERYQTRFSSERSRSRDSDRGRDRGDRDRGDRGDRDRGDRDRGDRDRGDRGRGDRDRGDRGRDRGGDSGRSGSPFGGRGGSPFGGGRGGRGGGDERGGRSFDPSRFIQRFDRDGDGSIDFDRMDEGTKRFASGLLGRYGLEAKGRVRVDDLVKKIQGKRGGGDSNRKSKEVKNPEMVASQIVRGADQYGGNYTFRRDRDDPTDVPAWWKDRDANRDGQVSMAEYLKQRTSGSVRNFNDLDQNQDGILEPSEVGPDD